ncbi:MAG: N-6 DNA methylase, partial [Bacteroidota bacterium]
MPTDKRSEIESALKSFVSGDLTKNSLALFETLGYTTDRRAPLDKPSFIQFKESYISVDSRFNEEKAQVREWKYVDLLFQLSANELIKTTDMFDSKAVVTKDDGNKIAIESYLFFVVELEGHNYSRTQLSHITREINRLFPMPVMILFKYGSFLTLAVIDRRLHKQDASKDVLEKVTLIKDINIGKPHRAHIEILFDLSFEELKENSKEPIINFIALQNAWRKTLNISELNKKFYRQIADWFYWAVSNVEYPLAPNITNERENASINVIRLLTRIIFVWFLKEKNLVPDDLFDEEKIAAILKDGDVQSDKKWNYYRAILQNLFFATLNQKMNTEKEPKNREWVSEKRASSGYNEDYTIANKYRFPELFKNPDQALQLFSTIPFLNGGLFDCLDRRGNKQKGDIFIDGFTRHTKPQPKVPNMLFFGKKRKVDLSKVFEDKKWSKEEVKGLIHILNDYKFTIAENTPIEEEVALDPELLGRIFENLLAAYNPETGTTARKATGSFYTPREIVNYMVDESILAYLKNVMLDEAAGAVIIGHEQVDAFGNDARKGQLKIEDKVERNPWKEKEKELENHLRDLLSYSERLNPFNITDTNRLISAIGRCKILDPACGSGAFPMGMLLKTVHILHKLDPNNAKWQQVQEDAARNIPDPEIQRDTLARIEEAFSPENNYADYGRKLVLIQNCIYGIDIQPIAVQISKLRFFISLLVDQKYNDAKENRGVLSLPNLETKFVAANTLIGIDESMQGSLHNVDIQQLVGKLQKVRKDIFNVRSYRNKKELQKQDEQLRRQLGALLEQKTLEAQKVLARQIETLKSQKAVSEKNLKEKNLLVGVRKQTEDVIKKINKQVEGLQTKLLDRHIVETNAMRLADWDPYDQNAHADFFDKEWMFGMKSGFDIVIGNPPYGGTYSANEKKHFQQNYISTKSIIGIQKGSLDTYTLFIEHGYNSLRTHGNLCYIVPISITSSDSMTALHKLLEENCE